MLKDKEKRLLKAMKKSENWKPDLTKISKETGIATSTIHDYYKRKIVRGKSFVPEISIIVCFPETKFFRDMEKNV